MTTNTPKVGSTAALILEAHPVGYVPARVIGDIVGVSAALVVSVARRFVPERAQGNAFHGFPSYPGSLRPLIDAWGVERARAWIAAHVPEALTSFDARAVKDESGVYDPSESDDLRRLHRKKGIVPELETPAARAKRKRVESTLRRLTAVLADHPVGLVPDGLIGAVVNVSDNEIKAWRAAKGVTPHSLHGNRFPHKPGSFMRLIIGWGIDRARTWVETHAAPLLHLFERDAGPRKALTKQEKGVATNHAATAGTSLQRAAELQRQPLFVPKWEGDAPNEKQLERERIAAALAEFHARGGKVTRGPSAGWGDPARSVYVRDEIGGMDADAT